MKTLKSILVITIILFVTVTTQAQKTDFPKLTGPYLGQKPPGYIPELFAPGIVSRDDIFEHSAAIFSPDNSEVYWSGKPNGTRYFKIYFMKMVDGKWTEPKIAFSHNEYNYGSPVFSSDGNKLFFDTREDIWFVERKGEDWSEAVQVSSIINSNSTETLRSITKDGSIYFSRYNANASSEGRLHEVYVSRIKERNYTAPIKLGKNINSDDMKEYGVYVAPDESYMIIEATKDAITTELFVSFRMKDNTWSERIKLPIKWGQFPSVSPDGKYLFFTTRGDICWVSAKIIEELRPKE